MVKALVNKIIPFSCVDGPGNRTAVFLQGCNFSCQYCHNPETIAACENCGECAAYCKTGALTFETGRVSYDSSRCVLCDECIRHCTRLSSPRTELLTAEETMERVRRNMPYIRGITVSGGECTIQAGYLRELLRLAKAEGLHTLLDSNGSYAFREDEELLDLCDGVMLDVKEADAVLHKELTGCENGQVLENLVFLAQRRKLYEVRTVVMAEHYAAENTIKCAGELLKPYLSEQNIRYKIIKYRSVGVREPYRSTLVPPSDEMLERLSGLAGNIGFKDIIII